MNRIERFNAAYNYLCDNYKYRSNKDIAEVMGATQGNVNRALHGYDSALTDRFITRFCIAFKIFNVNWLLTGAGEMLLNNKSEISVKSENISNVNDNTLIMLFKQVTQLSDRLISQIERLDEREKILDKREQDIYDRIQQAEKILNSAIQIKQHYPESLNTLKDKQPMMASEPFNEIKSK